MKRYIGIFFLSLCAFCCFASRVAASDMEVSLLTCSPGVRSYELYGHTALRFRSEAMRYDVVYNYGVFDYTRPGFSWHFILGECDYMLMPIPFVAFQDEYESRGSSVLAQRLNLTDTEVTRLHEMLRLNAQPENMVYRYDFLRNNCTTQVRDIVERAMDGEVIYPEPSERETYREMIHHYTASSPWTDFGQDLLLGCNCDTTLSIRAMMFLPEYLSQAYDGAVVRSDSRDTRPLVSERTVLLEGRPQHAEQGFVLTPLQGSVVFFAVMLFILALEGFFAMQFWGVDVVVMTLHGLVGLLMCFLFLFSEHPTLDSNFQVMLFNPLPLVEMFFVIPAARKRKRTLWHGFNFAWLFFFILFIPWVPQEYASGVFVIALSLMMRPISYFFAYRRYAQ